MKKSAKPTLWNFNYTVKYLCGCRLIRSMFKIISSQKLENASIFGS
jgi:hypothetical protein